MTSTRARSLAIIFLLGITLTGTTASAETAQQRLNEIVRDTQKQGSRAGRVTIVWWILPEFWRAAMAASGAVPMDKANELVESIADINILLIVDAKMGAFGVENFAVPEDIQKNLSVFDSQQKPLVPVPPDKQSMATKSMLAMTKPLMANMLGEFGKNMAFFVFEGKNKDGSRRVDPTKPGNFLVKLNVEEFRWRLPLGSLLPSKVCPKCTETFPGNYNYCPFDATLLVEKK